MATTVRPPAMGRMAYFVSSVYIDKRLTSLSRDIYGVISAHLSVKHEGWGYLPQRDIAELLGVSRQKVNEHIRRLVEYGYLDKNSRFYKTGAQAPSEYRVRLDFELPDEFSRLPVAPAEDSPGEDPPVTLAGHPLSPYGDTPVTLAGHPRHPTVTLNKDDLGNLNLGNLKERADPEPLFVKEADAEPEPEPDPVSPMAWARQVEWRNGLPRMSKALQLAGVTRKAGAARRLGTWLDEGLMPPFWAWEEVHFWPKAVFNSLTEREYEYKRFVTVVLAQKVDVPPDPLAVTV